MFQVKEDMQLAPIVRNRLSQAQVEELDEYVSSEKGQSFKPYLKLLKSNTYVKGRCERTWPAKNEVVDDDDDVMIVGKTF